MVRRFALALACGCFTFCPLEGGLRADAAPARRPGGGTRESVGSDWSVLLLFARTVQKTRQHRGGGGSNEFGMSL